MATSTVTTAGTWWCARGRWPARVRDHNAEGTRAVVVRALNADGMLIAGDLDLKSGQLVDVEIDLSADQSAVVTAEVRRALGAAFLRFTKTPITCQRERLLDAVGCPQAGGGEAPTSTSKHRSAAAIVAERSWFRRLRDKVH